MATEPVEIDVLVVCQHDAEMVKRCLTSAKEGATNKVNLWVWRNWGDDEALTDYLLSLSGTGTVCGVNLVGENLGFIVPNNELARNGAAPYLCLLNADTICAPGWDVPLVEALKQTEIVGYSGGWLSSDGVGRYAAFPGAPCDYVEGWCLMTTRAVWEVLGGFDEQHLTMAYGEDSDLCLRAKERGWEVKAVENDFTLREGIDPHVWSEQKYVTHLRDTNGGIGKGASEATRQSPELQAALRDNHAYIRERHRAYLESGRVLSRGGLLSAEWGPVHHEYGFPEPESSMDCLSFIKVLDNNGDNVILHMRQIDGRLWQLEIAGQRPVRMLVP